MNCRHCGATLEEILIDLGSSPPSNAYLSLADLRKAETHFPLRTLICTQCWLVQTEDHASAQELFSRDYAYFSSVSTTWLRHAADYARDIISRLAISSKHFVIEVAANDGYLLKNFVAARIPCLGIEPTDSTALVAERAGVPVLREFFGEKLGKHLAATARQADLIIGNNVYAHVPDINDFTRGLSHALKPGGTITLEFPHLLELLSGCQFDTIYHEHFSYLSLHAVNTIFGSAGLRIWDVQQLPTHGGSLRVFGCHIDAPQKPTPAVASTLRQEQVAGLRDIATYRSFQGRANAIKDALLEFLVSEKRAGRQVAGYGAAAKGNTLLNYAGVRSDLLSYVCDAAPSKQGKFLPGSRIPIVAPDRLRELRPDTVLILPWNIAAEVRAEHHYVTEWGGRFFVAVPSLQQIA